MSGSVRLETDDRHGRNTRVFYIAPDGNETEISDSVTAVFAEFDCTKVNTVMLRAYISSARLTADVKAVVDAKESK